MNKIDFKELDISLYTETLSNGLDVYMLPYDNKKNYFISYATRFGSDVLEFEKNGENVVLPLGIAHFLEHKMFEQEDGVDPFTYFSDSGTDSNASTSFDSTQYICYGNKFFMKNLKYLIHFVSNPYYTDKNVEKEKGIIAEEIKMYQDIPDFKLEMELRKCIYKNNPRRIDIAGTIDEINKITKEDLYKCYRNFYVPNNMFLLIVGNFNPEDTIEVIRSELEYRNSEQLPKIIAKEEPVAVCKKKKVLIENIEVGKIAIGIKIPIDSFKMKSFELDLYLHMITTILFGSSSEFRERVRNQNLISNSYMEWENVDNFRTFYFTATSIDPDKIIEEIKYELDNINITKKAFERIKKVWIANEIKMIDSINSTVNNLYDDIVKYNKVIPNRIEVIRNMKIEKLNQLLEKIDWKNRSIIKMEKKKE